MQERAGLVMSLAHGACVDDVCTREGVERQQVAAWTAELLHAAPESFDESMRHTLVEQGLADDTPCTRQSGRLEDIGALDLLQSLSIYKKAGHVLVFHAHGTSQLWFRDGELVDARCGALRGAEAVFRIAGHERGDFLVEVTGRPRPRTIERPAQALIFEAARRLDEARRLDAQLPDHAAELRCPPGVPTSGLADRFGDGATLGEVLERSELGELETRRQVAEAMAAGWLEPTGVVREAEVPTAEQRAAAIRMASLEISQPLVTMLGNEPGAPMSLEPIAAAPRRRRALAMAAGLAIVLVGVGLAIGVGMATPDEAAALPGLAPRVVVAQLPEQVGDTATVGTPRIVPVVSADAELELVLEEPPPDSIASSSPSSIEDQTERARPRSKGTRTSARRTPTETERRPTPQLAAEDHGTLLVRARSAYAAGHGATAHRLAARSHRMHPSPDAAELMVLAACQMKQPDRAHEALQRVPLLRRPSVRSRCKREHGVRPKRKR